jgi:hypothetical protein
VYYELNILLFGRRTKLDFLVNRFRNWYISLFRDLKAGSLIFRFFASLLTFLETYWRFIILPDPLSAESIICYFLPHVGFLRYMSHLLVWLCTNMAAFCI